MAKKNKKKNGILLAQILLLFDTFSIWLKSFDVR